MDENISPLKPKFDHIAALTLVSALVAFLLWFLILASVITGEDFALSRTIGQLPGILQIFLVSGLPLLVTIFSIWAIKRIRKTHELGMLSSEMVLIWSVALILVVIIVLTI